MALWLPCVAAMMISGFSDLCGEEGVEIRKTDNGGDCLDSREK